MGLLLFFGICMATAVLGHFVSSVSLESHLNALPLLLHMFQDCLSSKLIPKIKMWLLASDTMRRLLPHLPRCQPFKGPFSHSEPLQVLTAPGARPGLGVLPLPHPLCCPATSPVPRIVPFRPWAAAMGHHSNRPPLLLLFEEVLWVESKSSSFWFQTFGSPSPMNSYSSSFSLVG